jgi:heptaprenylglyceryl phosphate synthase
MPRGRSVLAHLRESRPSLLHAVDPFKVPLPEVVAKATALHELGFPGVLLASTDWDNFEDVVGRCVEEIHRAAPDFPVLLHFPPRAGVGLPCVNAADGMLCPFLLRSTDPYFVWRSYVETVRRFGEVQPQPELIDLAALTFGTDERSRSVLAVEPVVPSESSADQLLHVMQILDLHGAYLYSRYEAVPLEICRRFRAKMSRDQVLFVSGGVRTAEQANAFFDVGADFVVFCGALECHDWRERLQVLVEGSRVAQRPPSLRTHERSRSAGYA